MTLSAQPQSANGLREKGRQLLDVMSAVVTVASFGAPIWALMSSSVPTLPMVVGFERLSVVCVLAVLSWLAYGVIWASVDRFFAWQFGPGTGDRLPAGWSAIALSMSVTVPLTLIPLLLQYVADIRLVTDQHAKGMACVTVSGAIAHLLMYGTRSAPPNGIVERIRPFGQTVSSSSAVLCEVAYGVVFFTLMIIPYRLMVDGQTALWKLLVVRTALPALLFVSIMSALILLVPAVVNDPKSTAVRGIIGAGAMIFSLCIGLFL